MTQDEQLKKALETLENFVKGLAEAAGENESYAADLWERISKSGIGLLS